MNNYVICPNCQKTRWEYAPQKACMHGGGRARCVECGATKAGGAEVWACLGTVDDVEQAKADGTAMLSVKRGQNEQA